MYNKGRSHCCGTSQVVLVVKNTPVKAGDVRDAGSIPGLGRSSAEGNGSLLPYSCLEKPMDRRAWWATVHGGLMFISNFLISLYSCKAPHCFEVPLFLFL